MHPLSATMRSPSNSTAVGSARQPHFRTLQLSAAEPLRPEPVSKSLEPQAIPTRWPEITSDASRAAQVGPTRIVTSDAGGNLATAKPAELGLATLGDLSVLQSQIDGLAPRDSELTESIAIMAALAQPILCRDSTSRCESDELRSTARMQLDFRPLVSLRDLIQPGFGTVVLDGGIGVGMDHGGVVGRAGPSFG